MSIIHKEWTDILLSVDLMEFILKRIDPEVVLSAGQTTGGGVEKHPWRSAW